MYVYDYIHMYLDPLMMFLFMVPLIFVVATRYIWFGTDLPFLGQLKPSLRMAWLGLNLLLESFTSSWPT